MKPSQYLDQSYENYYYDKYIIQLSQVGKLKIPNKDLYLKQIHSTAPKCMIDFQKKYYKGCKGSSQYSGCEEDILFYTKSKYYSKESIQNFIMNADLDIVKLTEYLKESQKDKLYMMYKNNKFYLEKEY